MVRPSHPVIQLFSAPFDLHLTLNPSVQCSFFALLFKAASDADDSAISHDEMSAEDLAAEEAAAAAVEEAAEEEGEDDADALDEDADAARLRVDRHPLTDMPPPADDVRIAHTFTEGLDSTSVVTLGKTCKALVAFANEGRGLCHVWGVMGSLNMEHKFEIHVQNFTYGVVNKTVPANGELSFSYEFTPNERLDTRPFQLALTVFYETQGSTGKAIRGHSTTFYNATVGTVPGPQSISNGLFVVISLVLVGAAVAAYFVLKNTEAKKEAVEMGTATSSKNEWLEEHQNMIKSGGGRTKNGAGRK